MTHSLSQIKLLTGNSHPELAKVVSQRLGIPLCPCTVKKFSDNETSVSIGESVRDADVFIIQTGFNPAPLAPLPNSSPATASPTQVNTGASTSPNSASLPESPNYTPNADPNDLLMELLIMISACKTASARRITAVIPCFPYARMDRKERSRAPITAKLVANMLQVAGCDHVITIDLHASQIQGFFEVPVDNLWTEPIMTQYIQAEIEGWRNSVIVSPDAGGAKRATLLADRLGVGVALINSSRTADSLSGKMEVLVGDVKDKVAILIDDMCDTGVTVELAVATLNKAGASKVYGLVSHGLLSGDAVERLSCLQLEKLVVTNTICQSENIKRSKGKLQTMNVAPILAESIRRTHNGESISLLFKTGGAATF